MTGHAKGLSQTFLTNSVDRPNVALAAAMKLLLLLTWEANEVVADNNSTTMPSLEISVIGKEEVLFHPYLHLQAVPHRAKVAGYARKRGKLLARESSARPGVRAQTVARMDHAHQEGNFVTVLNLSAHRPPPRWIISGALE